MRQPNLASWAASLSFLPAEIAAGIEPLARRLDLVMTHDSAPVAGSDEPNGYAGLSRRGNIARLLLSDWMLATEEPDEFLRKYVSSELSYLELERTETRPPGRLLALVDTGPGQLGAARLAQLAALVVLMRRAEAAQVPFEIGLLASPAGNWTRGGASAVIDKWLHGRSPKVPSHSDIDEWVDTIGDDDSAWMLTSSTTGETLPTDNRISSILISESAWNDVGVTELSVAVRGRLVQLTLPAPELCVRILRGREATSSTRPRPQDIDHSLRAPTFPARSRQLVCRAIDDTHIGLVSLPDTSGGRTGRVRTKEFPGPVLAASLVGERLVVLVLVDDEVRVIVRGKSLARVSEIAVPCITLGLTDEVIRDQVGFTLRPLFFNAGAVQVQLGSTWWRLHPDDEPRALSTTVTICASDRADHLPLSAHMRGNELIAGSTWVGKVQQTSQVYFGAGSSLAFQREPDHVWTLRMPGAPETHVQVRADSTPIGVTLVESEPVLVHLSPGGHLVRMVGPTIERTLTKASRDGIVSHALHPTLPYLALQRESGRIDVFDVNENRRVAQVQAQQL